MTRKLILSFFILSIISILPARVFQVDKPRVFYTIGISTLLDFSNSFYLDNNVSSLTDRDLNTLSRNDIPFFDRWSMSSYDSGTDRLSSYLTLFSLGSTALFCSYDEPYTWDNLLVLSEVLAVQSVVCSWTKTLSLRNRPYVYDNKTPLEKKTDVEARLSFYSRHTSTAFAIAVYTHFYQHHAGNNHYLTGLSYGIATLVGITRIASGSHYFSDVISGAAIGSIISYLVCSSHKSLLIRNIRFGANSISYHFSF